MNDPIQAKSSPEVKPWVRRVVAAAVIGVSPRLLTTIGCIFMFSFPLLVFPAPRFNLFEDL